MLDFATLKISTNQSSHVTRLRLSDWSKFSVEYFMLDFLFIGLGPAGLFSHSFQPFLAVTNNIGKMLSDQVGSCSDLQSSKQGC